jgi:Spy/CpxP family protein refolding chaperone
MTGHEVSGTPPVGSRILAMAVLLAVAIAGATGGVLLDRMVFMPRGPRMGRSSFSASAMRGRMPSPESRRRFSDRMAKELGLTPTQQARVDTIMTRQFEGMQRASASVRPTIDSLVQAAQRSMDSVLTPEQRTKVQSMRRAPRQRGG